MATTTATTSFPPGIYYIVVTGDGFKSQRLTRSITDDGKTFVTVLPPSGDDKKAQEWQIESSQEGTSRDIISAPHKHGAFPVSYLIYRGAPKEPKAGDRIEAYLADVPENEWNLKSSFIQVVDSNLGIGIAPPAIHPPLLVLNENDKLKWKLEFIRFSQ